MAYFLLLTYHANDRHPLFYEIQSLVLKTTGIVPLLTEILTKDEEFKQSVLSAFVFGSIAKNEEKAASDIDFMIIGQIMAGEAS